MRRNLAAALAAALLALAAPAEASAPGNCPGPPPRPTTPLPPRAPAWASVPSGAKVSRTTVHLVCTREGWPKCAFSGEIAFLLPTGEAKTATGAGEVAFTGGRNHEHSSEPAGCGGDPDHPIFLRHYWTASTGSTHEAVVDIGAGLDGPVDVTLDAPPSLSLKMGLDGQGSPAESDAIHAKERGAAERVRLRRTLAASPVRVGGPFVAAGAVGGMDGPGREVWRPKIRAGYEMAAPYWLIESLSTETDFRSVTFVPAVEAAVSGNWMQVIAIGAGAPIRLVDRNTVGVRGQLAFQWPVLGVVGAVDYFPATAAGSKVHLSILGQVSF